MDWVIIGGSAAAIIGAILLFIAVVIKADTSVSERPEPVPVVKPADTLRAEVAADRARFEEVEEQFFILKDLYAADSVMWRGQISKCEDRLAELTKDVVLLKMRPQPTPSLPLKFEALEIKPLRINMVHYHPVKSKAKPKTPAPTAKPQPKK